MKNKLEMAKSFHGYLDAELVFKPGIIIETKEIKHLTIQEREVSYRFYPHFHPYAGQLMQRLLRRSVAGLQAADTEYEPGDVTLPDSIEIELNQDIELSIPGSSQFMLLGDLEATLPDNTKVALTAKLKLRLANAAQATVQSGTKAVLFEGMPGTPPSGSVFNLPHDMEASLSNDVKITLSAATQITLYDGRQASIPVGTQILLLSDTLTFPKDIQVTLLRSKPRPVLYADIFSPTQYDPSALVQRPYPVKDLDFTSSGAYSIYNWELFFHVPLTIAIHLSKNQHFAEAQHWFHYLFDPTDDSEGPTPERFWKVRPFQTTDVQKIEDILINLASNGDPKLRDETVRSIEAWKDAPFRPHVIARYRQQAYMYKTVTAYLDNLVSWGDSLFRQDTGEAIDEAMMLYVLAANILGPRPQMVPKKGSVRPQTYANLRNDLRQFGVVMRDVETASPFNLMPFPTEDEGNNESLATLRSLGKALYFCVPRNDMLLSYWDTVADRLFKIRNSLNIQGIFRQLPLFEPPIDPALLARAAAAGLDIGAVASGMNQPLPLVRFQLLVQKALEICQEVKSLGNNLLSAMEKEDGEALTILRARHERVVMEMVEQVRYAQVQEATKSKESLLKSLSLAVQRYTYYERQLGRKTDEIEKSIPELEELDEDSLEKMKFAMKEPEVSERQIEVDIATDAFAQAAQALNGGKILSSHEVRESLLLEGAQLSSDVANILNVVSSTSHFVPTFQINVQPLGAGGTVEYGGKNVGDAVGATAAAARAIADRLNYEARRAGRIDSFARREREWAFQSNLAAGEITQIFKQLRAAQIREAIAELELKNHRQQIKHAQEIERFLNEEGTEKSGKKTNKAMYAWMKREVKGLYASCFQLSFDISRKAERALQHELGNPKISYLEFGYLAGKEGLLAGEKLYLDIKRMEMAYYDLNEREYELTKHVSLLQVDPLALLQLRMTGRCTVKLPEELFDMDCPGHYFRRIKTVAVSIPCVTGPYASVNCTLTLLKSSIRKTSVSDGNYAREDTEDDRFSDYFGSLQSIVTSSAQNDSGMFETSLHDERYLPFEGSGVISEWQLELPANPSKNEPCQFDYDTISDIILHMRYTAREGGSVLRKGAMDNLGTLIGEAQAVGSMRLFSIRHEFPTEWAKFQNQTDSGNQRFELALNLRPEHYPYWSQGRLNSVKRVDIMVSSSEPGLDVFDKAENDGTEKKDSLVKAPNFGNLLVGKLSGEVKPLGDFRIFFNKRTMREIWMAITWSS
jgi:hypothetical protein